MKEVFDSSLITNESKPLVDQEPCDCAGRHARVLRLFPACRKVHACQHLLRDQVENAASVGASPYEVKATRHLPGFLFFLVFGIRILVHVLVGVFLVKLFIVKDFVVFVVLGVQKKVHKVLSKGDSYSGEGGLVGCFGDADAAVAAGGGTAAADAPGCDGYVVQ